MLLSDFQIYYLLQDDGSEYTGGVKDDQPYKFGILRDKRGKEYRSQFKNGDMEGICRINYPDGKIFFGQFKKGKKNGLGKVSYATKIYLGEFFENKRTGYGELIELEVADCLSSEREIAGHHHKKSTSARYVKKGTFKNGRLDGFGVLEAKLKKYTYEGFFKDDRADGDGTEITSEGQYYGTFKRGHRDGVGEYFSEGTFRGFWHEGLKDRFGIEQTASGNTYRGTYHKGKRTGYGKSESVDGTRYTGDFEKSQRDGFGRLEQGNNTYVGSFVRSKRCGLGYCKLSSGSSYFGNWENDLKNGIGYEVTEYDEYKGEWMDGQRHGRGMLKRNGEEPKYYYFNLGEIEGKCKENLGFIVSQFSKLILDGFFRESKLRLDSIEQNIERLHKEFDVEISYLKMGFDKEKRELEKRLLFNRKEFRTLEKTYEQLLSEFDRKLRREGGPKDAKKEMNSVASRPSNDGGGNSYEPLNFTPQKQQLRGGEYGNIQDNSRKKYGRYRHKDGETGRLMNSDYYTSMLRTSNNSSNNPKILKKYKNPGGGIPGNPKSKNSRQHSNKRGSPMINDMAMERLKTDSFENTREILERSREVIKEKKSRLNLAQSREMLEEVRYYVRREPQHHPENHPLQNYQRYRNEHQRYADYEESSSNPKQDDSYQLYKSKNRSKNKNKNSSYFLLKNQENEEVENDYPDSIQRQMNQIEQQINALESHRRKLVERKKRKDRCKKLNLSESHLNRTLTDLDGSSLFQKKTFETNNHYYNNETPVAPINPEPAVGYGRSSAHLLQRVKARIKSPHKVPPPESSSKNTLLTETSQNRFSLSESGYSQLRFFDEYLVVGGRPGLLVFKDTISGLHLIKKNTEYSIDQLGIWEDRQMIVCVEHGPNQNLHILNFKLKEVDEIEVYSKNCELASTRRHNSFLLVQHNLAIWNDRRRVMIADLLTKSLRVLEGFFEVKDSEAFPIAFLANPRKQIMVGYSKSYYTGKIYAHYAEESTRILKSTKILHISEKFSICDDFSSIVACGDQYYIVGGSATLERGGTKPLLLLTLTHESMSPISGNVIDVEGSRAITSLLALQDNNGYTVCAGAYGWVFTFKVKNNSLRLIQKFSMSDSSFAPDCISYSASSIYLLSSRSPNINVIRMDNYRPTRPHSLSYYQYRIDDIYTTVQAILDSRRKALKSRPKPLRVDPEIVGRFKKTMSYQMKRNTGFEHLEDSISGFCYKQFKRFFDDLSDFEKENLCCIEKIDDGMQHNGLLRVLQTSEKRLICLGDVVISTKLKYQFVDYNRFTQNLFVLEETGDLLIMNLQSFNYARIFDYAEQAAGYTLKAISSTKNCFRVLGIFNETGSENCIFLLYEKDNGVSVHSFPHFMEDSYDCETDFNQEAVFVTGRKETFAVLTAFEFDKDFLFICDYMKAEDAFYSVQRFVGTNLLTVQARTSVILVKYFEQSFSALKELGFNNNDLHSIYLKDFEVYVKPEAKSTVFMVSLPKTEEVAIDFKDLMEKERELKNDMDETFFLENPIEENMTPAEFKRLCDNFRLMSEEGRFGMSGGGGTVGEVGDEFDPEDEVRLSGYGDGRGVGEVRRFQLEVPNLPNKFLVKYDSDNKTTAKATHKQNSRIDLSLLQNTMPKFSPENTTNPDLHTEATQKSTYNNITLIANQVDGELVKEIENSEKISDTKTQQPSLKQIKGFAGVSKNHEESQKTDKIFPKKETIFTQQAQLSTQNLNFDKTQNDKSSSLNTQKYVYDSQKGSGQPWRPGNNRESLDTRFTRPSQTGLNEENGDHVNARYELRNSTSPHQNPSDLTQKYSSQKRGEAPKSIINPKPAKSGLSGSQKASQTPSISVIGVPNGQKTRPLRNGDIGQRSPQEESGADNVDLEAEYATFNKSQFNSNFQSTKKIDSRSPGDQIAQGADQRLRDHPENNKMLTTTFSKQLRNRSGLNSSNKASVKATGAQGYSSGGSVKSKGSSIKNETGCFKLKQESSSGSASVLQVQKLGRGAYTNISVLQSNIHPSRLELEDLQEVLQSSKLEGAAGLQNTQNVTPNNTLTNDLKNQLEGNQDGIKQHREGQVPQGQPPSQPDQNQASETNPNGQNPENTQNNQNSHNDDNSDSEGEGPNIRDYSKHEISNAPNYGGLQVVKIDISPSKKFIYFLSDLDTLHISPYSEDSLEYLPEPLTEEEIYNFCLLENDICVAFAVNRSSVMIYKGKRIVNVLHSADETAKNPVLTGCSHYVPFQLLQDRPGVTEGRRSLLWIEGTAGVKYLEFDPKEMDVTPGAILSLWKNDSSRFNEFIILTVEELYYRKKIVGLAFENEDISNTILQIYDIAEKSTQSFVTKKDVSGLQDMSLLCLIGMDYDQVLIAGGSVESGDGRRKGVLTVLALNQSGGEGADVEVRGLPDPFTSEYSAKFMNLKKIDENQFMACTECDLLMLIYEDQQIYILHIFMNIHEGDVFDSTLSGDYIFTVGSGGEDLCKRIRILDQVEEEEGEDGGGVGAGDGDAQEGEIGGEAAPKQD